MTRTLLTATLALSLFATGCTSEEDLVDVEETTEAIRTPVVVDGVEYQPEEMTAFDGQTLYYVLTQDAVDAGVVYAFTSLEKEQAFVQAQEPRILEQEAAAGQLRTITYSKFYDLSYYDNLFGKLKKGQSIANLASHPDYNNNDITSVKCRSGAYTYLWDDTSFSGGYFRCRNINVQHLNAYGWDNRASSIEVTP